MHMFKEAVRMRFSGIICSDCDSVLCDTVQRRFSGIICSDCYTVLCDKVRRRLWNLCGVSHSHICIVYGKEYVHLERKRGGG